jgi:Tol biopolymer transport system component
MPAIRTTILLSALMFAASPQAIPGDRNRIVFNRLAPVRIGLFLADTDGRNERPLLPAAGLDYDASFSADGKWIIFTSERAGSADIYRVHPDGAGLERITDSPSYDDQAALSPDGRTLAFVSTRDGGTANIWLLDLALHRYSNVTKNTSGNFRPAWSPDGKWIAFTSDRDTKAGRSEPTWELLQSIAVYIVHLDGSGLRRVTELGGVTGSPHWSPDGRRIVYYQSKVKDVFPGRSNGTAVSQIVSIDLETGERKEHTTGDGLKVSPRYVDREEIGYVIKTGEKQRLAFVSGQNGELGKIRNPSWSPDGKKMVYHKAMEAAVPTRMTPTFSRDPEFELYLTGNFPAFSPTGEQVVIAATPGLHIMDADGASPRTLFDAGGKLTVFPSWSPDGKHIVFSMGAFFDRPRKPGQVAMINADGSGLRMLTEGEASSGFPSWAPDGKRIVYRVAGKGEQGLRILSLEDGKVTKLTAEYDNFSAWSPRGDLIAFTSFRDGDFEIYTIRPDGSGIRKLTNTRGNDAHLVWSPDGKWIVFSSSRKGWKEEAMLLDNGPQPYGELFAMREDGSGVRQLTDNQWEDATAAWLPRVRVQSSE